MLRQYLIVVLMGKCSESESIASRSASLPGRMYFSASVNETWSGTGTMCISSTCAFFAPQSLYVP